MNNKVSDLHLESYRTLIYAVIAVTLVQIVFVFVDGETLGEVMVWLNGLHVMLSLMIGLWLYRCKTNLPSVKQLEVAFIVLSLPFFLTTWVAETTALQLGHLRQPLMPFQFLCVFFAILSPGRQWVAICHIVSALVIAVIFWLYLKSRFVLQGIVGEPWITLTYGFVSLMLLGARNYRRHLIQQLEQSRAEAEAFGRAARLFLAVRDRTNSPLQVINLCASLIKSRNPLETDTVDKMHRSIEKLQALTEILAETDQWRKTFEAGGDISKEIEVTFNKLNIETKKDDR